VESAFKFLETTVNQQKNIELDYLKFIPKRTLDAQGHVIDFRWALRIFLFDAHNKLNTIQIQIKCLLKSC